MDFNFRLLYGAGSILLSLGLFWMLLPHAFHESAADAAAVSAREIDSDLAHEEEPESSYSHYIHLLQGVIATILGLLIMEYSDRKLKSININRQSVKK